VITIVVYTTVACVSIYVITLITTIEPTKVISYWLQR